MIKQKKKPSRKLTKKPVRKIDEAGRLKKNIVLGMQEKKAKEIVCIDLRSLKNAIADYFVVCHADSRPHSEAIAGSVEEYVFKHLGEEPMHKEGLGNSEWILLDYVNVVVHIFRHEQREFYGIEKLWADAEMERIASNY